jgi:hypothetical protein
MEDQNKFAEIRHQGKELKLSIFLVCQKTQNVVRIVDVPTYDVTIT